MWLLIKKKSLVPSPKIFAAENNNIEMMAKCVSVQQWLWSFQSCVLHLHTNKRWNISNQKKGKAGTHAATSAIRRCSAQQHSWVIEWLHGGLVAPWPAPSWICCICWKHKCKKKKRISINRLAVCCYSNVPPHSDENQMNCVFKMETYSCLAV